MHCDECFRNPKIPDFFIIGAPKCGTTALSVYLAEHPQICFSAVKEPHFFSDDFPAYKLDGSLTDYLRRNFSHFDGGRHRAMGEGSVYYYCSEVAVANILNVNPNARFIYVVRNPADLVYSLYAQYSYNNAENLPNFELAWDAQARRATGRGIPRYQPEPRFLQYREMGLLGKRLQVLRSLIPPEQLLVIVFDDFAADTKQVYEDVLAFLDVPPDGRETFPVINESKAQRSRMLGYLTALIPRPLHNAVRDMKLAFGISHVPLNVLASFNEVPVERPMLSDAMRQRLIAEFEPDISLLEAQLGRDLGAWRR